MEFAVTLPLLLIVLVGVIETTEVLRLKGILTYASYEGARLASHQEMTSARVRKRCTELLKERGVNNGRVSISPANIGPLPAGTPIAVSVTAQKTTSFIASIMNGKIRITKTSTQLRD